MNDVKTCICIGVVAVYDGTIGTIEKHKMNNQIIDINLKEFGLLFIIINFEYSCSLLD